MKLDTKQKDTSMSSYDDSYHIQKITQKDARHLHNSIKDKTRKDHAFSSIQY